MIYPALPGWPMGLSGMYGMPDPVATPRTVQEEEDRAKLLVDSEADGFLALVYQLLYARGYRIDTTQGRVEKWRRELEKTKP
jgi:hypothetical protein